MKPILFSTSMVQAILEGRKTVTRRPIKPQPDRFFEVNAYPVYLYDVEWGIDRIYPRYNVDEVIYARETWAYQFGLYWHKAGSFPADTTPPDKWRPSIHMPREAARLFLRVGSVWAERLQDITGEQAIAEGFAPLVDVLTGAVAVSAREIFQAEWDNIYAAKGYGWEDKPWVFAYKFGRVERS